MTIAGCVPWIRSIDVPDAPRLVDVEPPGHRRRPGHVRRIGPRDPVEPPADRARAHGAAVEGPQHGPGGAARPQMVPQRWSTWFFRASPYGMAFDWGVGSQSRRASVGPAAGPASAGAAHHVLGVLPARRDERPVHRDADELVPPPAVADRASTGSPGRRTSRTPRRPCTMLPVPVGALRNAIAGIASSGTVGTVGHRPRRRSRRPACRRSGRSSRCPRGARASGRSSETPATSGRGSGVGVVGSPIVSETQPSTEKKKKSTLPQTSPWTYGSLTIDAVHLARADHGRSARRSR